MTSYSQDDYYYNNENDALSCNSRPISSNIHRKSSHKYESHTDTMYDSYGNTDGDIGDMNAQEAVAPYTHTYETTNASLKITPGVSSEGTYSDYGPVAMENTHTYARNDNTIYQQDAYGMHDEYRTTADFPDERSAVGGQYWSNSLGFVEEGRHTSLGTIKMLPKLPIKHSSSMLDGMYNSNNQQRYGASLPTTPPVVQPKCRVLPKTVKGSQNAPSGAREASGARALHSNHNGHSDSGYAVASAAGSTGGGVVMGKYLPTTPVRALPHLQSRQSYLKRQLFEDPATSPTVTPITTTTTLSNDLYISSSYDNTTINNYNNYGSSMYTSPTPHANIAFDAFYPMQRPHTSMAPLDYTEYDYGYACNSAENLSTYSDSPAMSASTTQQKLQQQQRKHSIIMAMTTASVIASGETRIVPHKKKALIGNQNSNNVNADNIEGSSIYAFEYDSSGAAAPKPDILTDANSTAPAHNKFYNEMTRGHVANSKYRTPANTTPIASARFSLSTSSSPSPSMAIEPTVATRSTSRKLPKRLPTPNIKYKAIAPTIVTCIDSNITNIVTAASTNSKQLRKLPQPKTTPSSIVGTKFDEVKPFKPHSISPISTTESTSTSASTLTPSLTLTSTTLTSLASTSVSAAPTVSAINTSISSISGIPVGEIQLASTTNEVASTSDYTITTVATSTTTASLNSSNSASPSKLTICSISNVVTSTTSSLPTSSILTTAVPDSATYVADSEVDKNGRHLYDMFVDLSNNNNNNSSSNIHNYTSNGISDSNSNKTKNNNHINDQLLFSERLNSSSTYFFDSLTNSSEPVPIKDKLMTTVDITDYLKSYPFPTYAANGSGSGIYNYDKSAYALPSSSTSKNSIPITATYSLPVKNSELTESHTKMCVNENSTLSNGYLSNLSYRFTSNLTSTNNSSISDSVKCSDHYLPSKSITYKDETTSVSTAIPTTLSSSFTTSEAILSQLSSSMSSSLSTTVASIPDSNVTTIATKSKPSLSFIAHTSTLPSSSLQLLLSPIEHKSKTINDASTLQSYPLSISTTTATSAYKSLEIDGGLFTTTIAATTTFPSTSNAADNITATANNFTCSTITETTFAEYLKGLDHLDSSSNVSNAITSITTTGASHIQTELPAYITDFLNTDYTKNYSTLLDYKFEDPNIQGLTGSVTSSTQAPTTERDVYEFMQPTVSVEANTANIITNDSANLVAYAIDLDQKEHCFDKPNVMFSPNYLSTMTSISPATTTIASGITASNVWSEPDDAKTITVASTTISSAFDDSFYDSYKVDLSSLAASIMTTETLANKRALDSQIPGATSPTATTNGTMLDSQPYPYVSFYSPMESNTNESDLTPTHTKLAIDYIPAITGTQQQLHSKITAPVMTTVNISTSTSSTQGGYYKPVTGKPATDTYEAPSHLSDISVVSMAAVMTSASPPKSSIASAYNSTGKATSMLGGLSRGIKGGLDGVLSGVSAVADSTRQPLPQSTIKGFGFGLASKLVPNVGGLLVGSSTSSKQQTYSHPQLVTSVSESYASAEASTVTTKPTPLYHEYDYQAGLAAFDCSSATTTASPTPTKEYLSNYNNESILNTHDNDVLLYTTDNSQLSLYNVSSDTRAFAMQQYPEDLLNSGLEIMYGAVSTEQQEHDNLHEIKHMSDDYKFVYDEYGFSEYDYDVGSMYEDRSKQLECDIMVVTTATGEIIATTTAAASELPFLDEQQTKTTASITVNTSSRNLAKKTTSSLLSSLTNAASHVQIQQPTSQPAPKLISSSGGMFGSFLGKAAAAMQSATQAVNQGASMATAVVQKIPSTSTATTSSNLNSVITESSTKVTNSAVTPGDYSLPMNSGDYHTQHLSHQDSLSSQYSTTVDDYENSNMLIYSTTPMKGLPSVDRNDKQYVNYYSNGNQTQSEQQLQLQHQEKQQQVAKLLPTVPPAGSSGKKLPTINGKSGYLIKQQPTEIFEDDDSELLNDDLIGQEPNYGIDSEQDDYYMDHQQTSPSSRTTLAGNGYYEHTNGGYDYREDFFNEEDEFKYLQKEEEQKAREELLYHQHHQKQQEQLLHQKHSSLDYVEEGNDNFIDDSYPSEDSGNYLDESSSGSVGVVGSKSKHEFPVDCIMQVANSSVNLSPPPAIPLMRTSLGAMQAIGQVHQQIKKQDSIIMEEDEDELSSLTAVASPIHASISKAPLSRKSSSILIDEDEISDLPSIHMNQKKKMLLRSSTEDVVSGNMPMIRKPEVTAKQRWHWAYSKIIMQLNVSTSIFTYCFNNFLQYSLV